MPILKSLKKKQRLLYFFIFLLLSFLVFFICIFRNDAAKFNKLTNELFVSDLSENTLSLHYTLAYPENYGITSDAVLPAYQENSEMLDGTDSINKTLSALSSISKEHLNQNDAFTYDLLVRYLNKRLEGEAFAYYSEPLSPNSGMQSGLPILLADYTFRRAEDIEDYLSLLEQTDTYFEGLVQYETEKAKKGLFMPDYSASKVIAQCDSIMDASLLSEGEHFLHTTFKERLEELKEENIISDEEAGKWLLENDRLLTTVMLPAYEKTADAFTVLNGKGLNDKGLFYYPDGQAYYEYLLSMTTGSDRSVKEIKELLFHDFESNYNALLALVRKHPALASFNLSDSLSLPFDTPGEMLEDLQARMSADFPAFPSFPAQKSSISGEKDTANGGHNAFSPVCKIKNVSSSMENYCSPAYYLTPPIDDMQNNIIYINRKNSPDSLTLYTTLAHEGYPGHLYQTVYSQLYRNEKKENPIRSLLHYGGYVEGWALYVENLSYYYAQAQVKEQNPDAAVYYECCRLNRNIQLCLYSLLDIAIHHEGASLNQVGKILQTIGITRTETVTSIYQYIVEEPVNYLKYYLGFLELNLLKEEARNLWGPDFSLYRFHQFVLNAGPSDFKGLSNRLAAS